MKEKQPKAKGSTERWLCFSKGCFSNFPSIRVVQVKRTLKSWQKEKDSGWSSCCHSSRLISLDLEMESPKGVLGEDDTAQPVMLRKSHIRTVWRASGFLLNMPPHAHVCFQSALLKLWPKWNQSGRWTRRSTGPGNHLVLETTLFPKRRKGGLKKTSSGLLHHIWDFKLVWPQTSLEQMT